MPYRLISAQMLLEHEVIARLSDALRTVIGSASHGDQSRKLASLRLLAESFQRHLERMLELEEHGGYMDLVQTSYPAYQPQIALFRREHDELRDTSQELGQRLDAANLPQEAEIEPLFAALLALLENVESHNNRERELLQEIIAQHHPEGA